MCGWSLRKGRTGGCGRGPGRGADRGAGPGAVGGARRVPGITTPFPPQKPVLSLEETLNVTEGNFHQLVALLHCRGLHKVTPVPLPELCSQGTLCLDPET